ncbi:dTDP-4-dehydrorhamnose 3,5-epimerase [Leptospira sp. 96542]|nr:dTDP-4-dehydrorhamnose 3,5-epimerase [Leptospira sp. 96542]
MSLLNIQVTPIREIVTSGGNVLHGLKSNESSFQGFGEAYFSWVEVGAIKAWKRHNEMVMNLIVPFGNVHFAFYDSDTNNFFSIAVGENNYSRITVPSGIWFGFQGLKSPKSLVLNISNIPHDPSETDRLEISKIHYDWVNL